MPKLARRAFSLVELLTVISIISLLVAILLPVLNRAKELARRGVCTANLSALGKALSMYTAGNNNQYPYRAITGSCTDAVGTGSSNSVNLKLLRITGLCQNETFLCPSTSNVSDPNAVADPDFAGRNNVSYGYQVPYDSLNNGPGRGPGAVSVTRSPISLVIMADMNPNMDSTGAWNASWGDPNTNSPNHKSEGQNALHLDSHVSWEVDPRCGYPHSPDPTANDNIYSSTASGGRDVPQSVNDSMIAP